MRAERPSQTASLVAVWRALAIAGFTTARGFSDEAALALLSPGWARFYRMMVRGLSRAKPEGRAKTMARVDVLPLRVMAIDAELLAAVAAGCRQVVVLGAGLDTRAYRLAALAEADVLEVDHPATQAYKRRKAEALRPLARSLRYVAVDFERDSLAERLRAAGHRADRATVWVWEGVVMDLSDPALRATLEALVATSASGSVLVLHYHEPNPRGQGFRLLLRLWREPQIGLRTRDTMHAELQRVGLAVVRDSTPDEWVARFGAAPLTGTTAQVTRLVVARKP